MQIIDKEVMVKGNITYYLLGVSRQSIKVYLKGAIIREGKPFFWIRRGI